MQEKEVKLKGISSYAGLSISASKVVTLNVNLEYSEIVTSVNLLQTLNSDVTVLVKLGLKKPVNLGVFTVNGIKFDKDGNSKVTLKSMIGSVDLDNIMDFVECDDTTQLMFKSIIELPGEVEEVDDDEEGLPFN